ncbi:hypothetical protein KFL_004530150 [Klebsormidium nitens]|uniref:Uncharacterized protein n=1 Tax=Klebsormidium nitens TaxID=105231 RepID=A0A1Y1ICS4_KLENI|nr:hypothetical protein KFL_004530150 [Klebsormidium nitens]|eukprot:GAQ88710.1 hypothetical protein KFL_004530150 [Klebsormidium nitens]
MGDRGRRHRATEEGQRSKRGRSPQTTVQQRRRDEEAERWEAQPEHQKSGAGRLAMDITRLLQHPSIESTTGISAEEKQDLALVFIKAFKDEGNAFPIDFDEVWTFLEYSTKGNALQKLKRNFKEDIDYIVRKGTPYTSLGSSPKRGSTPDRYLLTTKAFEFFSMSTTGSKGDRERVLTGKHLREKSGHPNNLSSLILQFFILQSVQEQGQLRRKGLRKRVSMLFPALAQPFGMSLCLKVPFPRILVGHPKPLGRYPAGLCYITQHPRDDD